MQRNSEPLTGKARENYNRKWFKDKRYLTATKSTNSQQQMVESFRIRETYIRKQQSTVSSQPSISNENKDER